ncbi:MAG: GNAT family N-acetyltransferase [Maritimibacter sp.]
MLGRSKKVLIETERLVMRPLQHSDFRGWSTVRHQSQGFLTPWEPTWAEDHLSRKSFSNRVYWSNRAVAQGTAVPLVMVRKQDGVLVGSITLDNIRRGPSQAATVGYWIGAPFARQGFMREGLAAMLEHAFSDMGLSRLEAGCLPENAASRGVLEKVGFKYEGVAQAYLQINGRWRNHVLYAALRLDRRGKTDAG